MKMWLFAIVALTAIVAATGCAKKDEGGGGPPPGCPGGHYSSATHGGQCLPQSNCPVGSVQHPSQTSLCIDYRTGQVVGTQQCGPGFALTARGCGILGQCSNGYALVGESCLQPQSGGQWQPQQQMGYPYSGGGFNSYYGGGYGGGYGGYGSGYGGYMPWNPYVGYR